MFARYQTRIRARADGLLLSLEGRLDRIMQGWLLFAGLACAARIAFSPRIAPIGIEAVLPYILLILAPFASIVSWTGSPGLTGNGALAITTPAAGSPGPRRATS